MPSILIVENDTVRRSARSRLLTGHGYRTTEAASEAEAVSYLESNTFDLVLTDLPEREDSRPDILKVCRRLHPETEVIIVAAFESTERAVAALQNGARDFLIEPFTDEELVIRIGRELERIELRKEIRFLKQEVANRFGFDNIIGSSKVITDLKKVMGRIANTDITVLITGESGTGKELFAKVIHHHSSRRNKSFIPFSCSILREELLESELFGHVRGATASAVANKRGVFEEAEGGTLFLDDVGDLPLPSQAKLLQVLQDKEIRPIGGSLTRSTNVRIIAAANADLARKVQAGKFREDLFYRLNVMPLHIPPLRERPEDIPPLADYFLRKIQREYGRDQITPAADSLELLLRHTWPGNVRELENTLKRAAALSGGDTINERDVIFISPKQTRLTPEPAPEATGRSLQETQKIQILKSLEENNWNYSLTADRLGIGRTTLWRKVRKFNLKQPEAVG